MPKLTLADISDLYNPVTTVSQINANSALIETALENTLSRDGTSPNTMSAPIDMNSNPIYNVADPVDGQSAATKSYVDGAIALVNGAPLSETVDATLAALGIDQEITVSGANHTLAASGTSVIVNLTGSTPYTVTAGDYTTYPDSYSATIVNNTTRGWPITVTGETIRIGRVDSSTFTLYPTQVCKLIRTSTGWVIKNDFRWRLTQDLTLYVDHTNGSNTNDGLTTGSALATIQKAIETYEAVIDCMQNSPAIRVLSTDFTENNVVHTKRIVGFHVLYIYGNVASPSSCIWRASAGQTNVQARDWSGLILDGFQFEGTGSGCTAISASQHGIIDISNIIFGTYAGGIHVVSTNGGSVGYSSAVNVSIVGDAVYHWYVNSESTLLCSGVASYTIPTARAFTAFMVLQGGTINLSGFTFTGAGVAGTTGAKFVISDWGFLIDGGITLPGTTAGYEQIRFKANTDSGGLANHISITGTTDLAARSTGVGTIKFDDATSRDSAGFIKIYVGTTPYYIPLFAAI